jgi:hypothetical protein
MSRTNSSAGRLGGPKVLSCLNRPEATGRPSSAFPGPIAPLARPPAFATPFQRLCEGSGPSGMSEYALTRYPNYKALPLPCARRAAFFSRLRAARSLRCFAWIFLRRESVILGIGIILFLGPIQGRLCCHAVGIGECAIDSRRAAMNTRCRRAYARRTPRNTPSTPLLRQRTCHTVKPFPTRRSAMPRLYQTVASGYIALPQGASIRQSRCLLPGVARCPARACGLTKPPEVGMRVSARSTRTSGGCTPSALPTAGCGEGAGRGARERANG